MIDSAARNALTALLGNRVEFDVPLSRHTSLRIGGPAEAMATPANQDELASVLALCSRLEIPTRVLGSGFNVLVQESGLRGVVLKLKKLRRIERTNDDAIYIEAGASHATITRYCVEHGLTGLEFGAGIPGTLGGWLAMNAGIGVREMADVVRGLDLIGASGERPPRRPRAELEFHYRELAGLPKGAVLIGAELAVKETDPATVQQEIDRLLAHRQSTQPTDIPSCGSVFRNPPGDFAGRLIESCDLKGTREGGAEISTVHANFIVNHGGATADDVLTLIEKARTLVAERTGIHLETEVQLLGTDAPSQPGASA